MPQYRIHRIKETPRENFRWAAHTGGEVVVKLKDYEASRTAESATPYAAWKLLRDEGEALAPGDLLEILEAGFESVQPDSPERQAKLLIAKYIGFEPARWYVPEPKAGEARAKGPALSSEPPVEMPTAPA